MIWESWEIYNRVKAIDLALSCFDKCYQNPNFDKLLVDCINKMCSDRRFPTTYEEALSRFRTKLQIKIPIEVVAMERDVMESYRKIMERLKELKDQLEGPQSPSFIVKKLEEISLRKIKLGLEEAKASELSKSSLHKFDLSHLEPERKMTSTMEDYISVFQQKFQEELQRMNLELENVVQEYRIAVEKWPEIKASIEAEIAKLEEQKENLFTEWQQKAKSLGKEDLALHTIVRFLRREYIDGWYERHRCSVCESRRGLAFSDLSKGYEFFRHRLFCKSCISCKGCPNHY